MKLLPAILLVSLAIPALNISGQEKVPRKEERIEVTDDFVNPQSPTPGEAPVYVVPMTVIEDYAKAAKETSTEDCFNKLNTFYNHEWGLYSNDLEEAARLDIVGASIGNSDYGRPARDEAQSEMKRVLSDPRLLKSLGDLREGKSKFDQAIENAKTHNTFNNLESAKHLITSLRQALLNYTQITEVQVLAPNAGGNLSNTIPAVKQEFSWRCSTHEENLENQKALDDCIKTRCLGPGMVIPAPQSSPASH